MFHSKPTTTAKLTKEVIGSILTERNNEIVLDPIQNISIQDDDTRDNHSKENDMRAKHAKVRFDLIQNLVLTSSYCRLLKVNQGENHNESLLNVGEHQLNQIFLDQNHVDDRRHFLRSKFLNKL